MHDCVDTIDSRPLYFTKHDEAFTRLAVDYVAQYTVFYLASSKLSAAQSLLFPPDKLFYRRLFIGRFACQQ